MAYLDGDIGELFGATLPSFSNVLSWRDSIGVEGRAEARWSMKVSGTSIGYEDLNESHLRSVGSFIDRLNMDSLS